MARKILVLCAAIMAFAVVPAVASATNTPELVESGGGTVGVGSLIEATNIGNIVMTGATTSVQLSCEVAILTGEVLKNSGYSVEADLSAVSMKNSGSSNCSGSFGAFAVTTAVATNGMPWCIRSTSAMATDEVQLRGNGCSQAARAIRFILDMPYMECTYQRASPFSGKFSTGIGSTTLSMSHVEFPRFAGSSLCSSVLYLDLTVMLETEGTSTRIDVT
jgi:hypothetical protein